MRRGHSHDRRVAQRSFRSALGNPDVRRLLAGQAAGAATELTVTTALAIYLVEVLGTGGVALLSLRYLPAALLGSLGSVPADVAGPRRALIGVGVVRAAMIAGAAVAIGTGAPIGVVLAFAVGDSLAAMCGYPAGAAAQVSVARSPAELVATSALASNVKSVFMVTGGMLGGFLSAALPTYAVFAVAAGITLGGAVAVLRLGVRRPRRSASVRTHLRGALGGEWRTLRDANIAHVVAASAVRSTLYSAWAGLAVLAAAGFLGTGDAGVGALAGAAGAGALLSIPVGVAMIGRPRLGALLTVALAVTGGALVLVAVTGSAAAALVLIVFFGLGNAVADMGVGALLPRVARDAGVTRVTSIDGTARRAMKAVGAALVPLSAIVAGTRTAVAFWGLLAITVALLARRGLNRVDVDVAAHLRVVERVRALPLFAVLRVVELERVAAALERRQVAAGESLVVEGQMGGRTLFILGGASAEVTVHGAHVRDLVPGDCFGEIALLHDVARTATVTATSDGDVFVLDREDFLRALTSDEAGEEAIARPQPFEGHRSVELDAALRVMPLFAGVGADGRAALAAAADVRDVPAGTVLCAEGEPAASVFVVLEGTAEVLFGGATLRTVGPGALVGEIALLHGVARTATVRSRETMRIAELSTDAIAAALGHAPQARDLPAHLI